ncbi:Zn(II)2Cys6 transcription factor [Aspergillus thermomutatus]|uniref:Zn(2)-C6 fungal-type domain-containing protein n=1 Tax=Aspergillus thermomutatus TaxID=41047 RepID=A0A397H1I0_ASPTH|nr:uncharacterized protein CDV56_102020 [Aspergillus thermomutatus]RHZ54230.1 hypothetical protein CDV56_102020 [Aspergillus thermomutatus]
MPASRSSVTKRACDGCKIRKIRCGGGQPCQACTNSHIRCTYIRVQQPRGPQRLRSTTKYLIEQTQRGLDAQNAGCASLPVGQAGHRTERLRIPTNVLAPPLYIYHMRMYPVWPIVTVESLISVLQEDPERRDLSTYTLATAVAAATLAQLKLEDLNTVDSPTADAFAAECLHARDSCGYRSKPSLDNIRTSFFLHVYYENQQSGGSESLLYLREAITMAQMMRLHEEASYIGLGPEEQQLRRRVLWLLFVTERGVCILHKLPVILRTNISTPGLDVNDEPQVLPAFLKLLNLFRLFEKSKMFDVIEWETVGAHDLSGTGRVGAAGSYVGRAEGRFMCHPALDASDLVEESVKKQDDKRAFTDVAFLAVISSNGGEGALDHSNSELKLYEIASSLADAVMNLAMLPRPPIWDVESRPSQILARLHTILSTFRGGGNKQLVELLYKKMAEAQSISGLTLGASLKAPAGKPQFRQSPESSTCRNAMRENAFLGQSPAESSQVVMTGWFSFGPPYTLQAGGDIAQPDCFDDCILPDDMVLGIASASDTPADAWTTESQVTTEDMGEMASLFTSLPSWTTPPGEIILEDCPKEDVLNDTSFETFLPTNEDITIWHTPIVGT